MNPTLGRPKPPENTDQGDPENRKLKSGDLLPTSPGWEKISDEKAELKAMEDTPLPMSATQQWLENKSSSCRSRADAE